LSEKVVWTYYLVLLIKKRLNLPISCLEVNMFSVSSWNIVSESLFFSRNFISAEVIFLIGREALWSKSWNLFIGKKILKVDLRIENFFNSLAV